MLYIPHRHGTDVLPPRLFFAFWLGCCLMLARASGGEWQTARRTAQLVGREGVFLFEAVDFPDAEGTLTCRVLTDGRPSSFRVSVQLGDDASDFSPGTRFSAVTTLTAPSGTGRQTALAKRIRLRAYAAGNLTLLRSGGFRLRYGPQYLRHRLTALCDTVFGEMGWLPRGLLFGDKSGFPEGFAADASDAGVAHMFAVSGMHLSFLVAAMLVLGAGKPMKLTACGLCLLFTAITGFTPSVVRACVMQLAALAGSLTGRDTDRYTPSLAALSLLLFWNVWSAGDAGLQFSFVSVLGILLFGLPLLQKCPPALLRKPVTGIKRVCRRLWESAAISLVCQLVTLPLTVLYYDRVSLVGILSNLLLGPVLPVLFVGCIAALLLGLVWVPLGTLPGTALALLLKALQGFISGIAALPFSALGIRSFLTVPALLCLLALWVFVLRGARRHRHIGAGLLLSILVLGGALSGDALLHRGMLTVTALDMGGGRCTVLRQGSAVAVVDCARRYGAPAEALTRYLRSENLREIDVLIVTYLDDTERSGAEELIARGLVGQLYLAAYAGNTEAAAALQATAREHQVPVTVLTADAHLSLGDARISLALPAQSGSARGTVLCEVSYGGASVWITGKTSADGQTRVLETRSFEDPVMIVAAGESGSCIASALLDKADPGLAVVSCSRPVTLPEGKSCELYTTDEWGTLEFLFRKGRIRVRTP